MRWLGIAFAVIAGATSGALAGTPVDFAITNVTVYAGDTAPFVATIGVRDGAFVAIDRNHSETLDAATTIDGTGKFLMPGLWDMHVHMRAVESGGMDVAAFPKHGVTSVRDLGGFIDRIKTLEREIASGAVGPTIYAAYTTLNGKAFAPFQLAVTNEAEITAAIDKLKAAGAVQIKIHRALAPEMLPVLIRVAHARGLEVTGHIPLGVHPLDACQQGMDGVEHIGSFLEAYLSVTKGADAIKAIDYMLSPASEPLYQCLATRGVEVTPTLVVYPAVARARGKFGSPEANAFIDGVKKITLRLHRAGVTLLSGTDTSDLDTMAIPPGSSLLDELEMLQDAGIPPADVIQIATANAARTLGVFSRTGSIAVSKSADFLLLRSDPGKSIAHVRDREAVYRAGKRVP